MKLSLYYPTKPLIINQAFGTDETQPELLEKYKAFGLKGHNGIDFYAYDGMEVRATHDGEVTYAGEDGSNGLLVVLRTLEEFDYLTGKAYFKTLYGHLKRGSFNVKAGDQVKAGQLLALADNTGFSSGSHLHFGTKPVFPGETDWQWYNLEQDNGYNGAIDPSPYFNQLFAKDVGLTKPTNYQFTKDFGLGSISKDVWELQKRLVKDGFADFIPMAWFGGKTLIAVKLFQQEHGIPDTGYVGPLTRSALNT